MSNDHNTALLPDRDYVQTSADLIALKATLPREAVISVAREVLSQLASRVADAAPRTDSVTRLSRALIDDDPRAAAIEIEAHHKRGVSVEALLLGYLGPAARQLGEWWETDEITFATVTIGTGRIYAIMRMLNRLLPIATVPEHKAALVASVPGETHVLGARMAADLMRDKGWTIDLEMGLEHEELMESIASSGHLVLGLSAAGEHALPALARLVLAVQMAHPQIAIFVGGNIVAECREQVSLMGIDAQSQNFAESAALVDTLWERVSARDI